MKVYNSIDALVDLPRSVVTQGTFDGVHLGHQKILKRVCALAKEKECVSTLLTFYPHPRLVLYPNDNDLKLLTSLEEKMVFLEEIGIDQLVVLPFTKELSRMVPYEFVRDILINGLNMQKLVIGYDHRFGKNREGSISSLREMTNVYDFEMEEIPAFDIEESIISSSKIRNSLLKGNVENASKLLGRVYNLKGTVVKGRKQGRVLGYPTANIVVNNSFKLIPSNGVYAVKVRYDDHIYGGMMNIGDNPTFEDANWSCEVHIFDFDKDIYNEEIEVLFQTRMRDELKFNNPSELTEQLEQDEIDAKTYLSNH